jgi:hypothetical protein
VTVAGALRQRDFPRRPRASLPLRLDFRLLFATFVLEREERLLRATAFELFEPGFFLVTFDFFEDRALAFFDFEPLPAGAAKAIEMLRAIVTRTVRALRKGSLATVIIFNTILSIVRPTDAL